MAMKAFLSCCFLVNILSISAFIRQQQVGKPRVILVSMDGFRYDYLTKTELPNFDYMAKTGCKVPYINITFVTLTFPCHYTIATGRYEESHGIIANRMFDPQLNEYFGMSTTDTRWWDMAEPIWTTAVKAGLKAGTYFWPGSEAEVEKIRPTQYRKYNKEATFEDRVKILVDWMSQYDYDLGLIYFNEPDHSGHRVGPDNPDLLKVIRQMDDILGLLFAELDRVGMKDMVDVIVTSDHGMATIDYNNKLVNVWDYVDNTTLKEVVYDGTTIHLLPQPGKKQELYEALKDVQHLTVYTKENIPERFHYKNNRRVTPVFGYMEEGWSITRNTTYRKSINLKGDHGYDNTVKTMKPIFLARGPNFKEGYTGDPIKSVDIYPLICDILKITPAPNNGSLERTSGLRKPPTYSPKVKFCEHNSAPIFCSLPRAIVLFILGLLKTFIF